MQYSSSKDASDMIPKPIVLCTMFSDESCWYVVQILYPLGRLNLPWIRSRLMEIYVADSVHLLDDILMQTKVD